MVDDQQRKIVSVIGSLIFLLIAPMTVVGLIPYWITRWQRESSFGAAAFLRVVGVLLIIAGVSVLLDSFARFAIEGLGTPAPIFPTRHLVVQGLYRYVRNPMYVALIMAITGQALLFGSLHLIEYAAVVWLCTHLFVVGYEEPKLRATFGAGYEAFLAHVPRWIPRVRPWDHNA
jgi:protein-S-isoprenylcysteine O-methyltransferase Ste14